MPRFLILVAALAFAPVPASAQPAKSTPAPARRDRPCKRDWSILERQDGEPQWVYKARPLHTFSKDTAPGQRNGNGYNGNRWHVAEP